MKDTFVKEEMKFSYTQLPAFEKCLSQKEESGLRFLKIENGKMFFERATQRKIKYSAVIFTAFSMREEFIEACKSQGWEYVSCYCDELYIFRAQKPDAQKIITDEKEYFKAIAKKAFFQPGYIKLLLWSLFLFVTTVAFRGRYDGLIATNLEDCAVLMFVTFSLLQTVARVIHLASWYVKNKRQLNETSKIIFVGAEEAEKHLRKWDVATVVQLVLVLVAVVVLGAGYCDITLYCWICAGLIIISLFDVVKNLVGKENKKKRYATIAVWGAIIIASVFGVTQWAGAELEKNIGATLGYNGAPISVGDFAETKEKCTDKTLSVKSTRLGTHYIFSSDCDEDENTGYYINYEVFASDYNRVTQDYVKSLHKRYEDYGSKLIKAENTNGWDEVYHEVIDGKVSNRGYAVKENLVVMLDVADLPAEADFFETAYKKVV